MLSNLPWDVTAGLCSSAKRVARSRLRRLAARRRLAFHHRLGSALVASVRDIVVEAM